MAWAVAIALAFLCFAVVAFAFRVPRAVWTTVLAALALGLAGFGLQARPGVPAAPAVPPVQTEDGLGMVEARHVFTGEEGMSQNPKLLTSDAMARKGRFANAAAFAGAAAREDPGDAAAWVALGNALVENADGTLTPASIYAYRRATEADPGSLAPGFFMGTALIRQGRVLEAHQIWAEALRVAPQDAPGREQLQQRLQILEELLRRLAQPEAGD